MTPLYIQDSLLINICIDFHKEKVQEANCCIPKEGLPAFVMYPSATYSRKAEANSYLTEVRDNPVVSYGSICGHNTWLYTPDCQVISWEQMCIVKYLILKLLTDHDVVKEVLRCRCKFTV